MTNQAPRAESKRILAFRLGLVKAIPKFPNDRTSLQTLERKSLGALLIDYANWAIRYVAPRPRKVIVEPAASSDPRWTLLQADISAFLSKVERGEDLTPHLSLEPHKRGYTPQASGTGPERAIADRFMSDVQSLYDGCRVKDSYTSEAVQFLDKYGSTSGAILKVKELFGVDVSGDYPIHQFHFP